MGIPIPGATREAFEATRTATSSKPFPFVSGKWTNHTAEVASVEISHDESGRGNDQVVVRARNGEHECRIYVSLDPNQVGPNTPNPQEAIQRNVDRLMKLGKVLDVAVWKGNAMEIEPKLFPKAVGKVIEIGIQGAVDRTTRQPLMNKKGYQIINTTLSGAARELRPVVQMVASEPAPAVTGDIPF